MNPCIASHKYAIRSLNHFLIRSLLRVLLKWKYDNTQNALKSPLRSSLLIETTEKSNSLKKNPKSSPRSTPNSRIDSSPINASNRLYNHAQEIENHKNQIRKSLIPEYSFTPKLSSGTQKWLNSKSKKEIKTEEKEIAVVSGSKVLNFTKFASGMQEMIENKIDTQIGKTTELKSRIFKKRSERRSDIVSSLCFSPDKNKTHLNKSNSKV